MPSRSGRTIPPRPELPAPVELLGLPIHPVTLQQAVLAVERSVLAGQGAPLRHVALNASKVVLAHDSAQLRDDIRAAGLVTADGAGVLLLAWRLRRSLPERVTGIDLMDALCARAAIRRWPVYLLGAAPGVADAAAWALVARYPGLLIGGAEHGYFADRDSPLVARRIKASGARLLFVGIDTPRKERFVAACADEAGVDFAMGVGGAFDVLAGQRRRAPRLLQGAGLEWAFRWAQEPVRLFPRYGLGGLRFAWTLLRARAAPVERGRPKDLVP